MRRRAATLTVLVALVLLATAGVRERGDAQTILTPPTPRGITFKPVDTTKALGTRNLKGAIRTPPVVPSAGPVSRFFRPTPTPSLPRGRVAAPIVTPDQNKFQPGQPLGRLILDPTPPKAGSKSIFDFPFNPFKKS